MSVYKICFSSAGISGIASRVTTISPVALRRTLTLSWPNSALFSGKSSNPVDVELDSFFDCGQTRKCPLADLEVGLLDSTTVILSNQAMYEGRRVLFSEIDRMGKGPIAPKKAV